MEDKYIVIKGARQHNLKNIDVKIPRDKLVVFTGLSGSGKSSLAFDTIYAEGQRRYVESLSAYARQFLGQMDKPDVDYIEGLSPAISIDQKTTSRNPRSTVGTVTEIYDYLRLLYARVGEAYCPKCGKPIRQQTIEQMADAVMALGEGEKVMVMAPVVDGRKGTHQKLLAKLVKDGYVRVRVDGEVYLLSDDIPLDKNKKHTIDVIIDRLVIKDSILTRLTDSLETAAKLADGIVHIFRMATKEVLTFSQHFACPDCHVSLPEIEPHLFSFNSPFGACPACSGIGSTMEVDARLVLPDRKKSFADGAVAALSSNPDSWFMRQLGGLLRPYGFTLDNCYDDLPEELQEKLMDGSDDLCVFEYENLRGQVKQFSTTFEGVLPMVRRRYREASSDMMRDQFGQFMTVKPCSTCHGTRLRHEALAIKIGGLNIAELTDLPVSDMIPFFDSLKLTEKQQLIGKQIFKEIKARITRLYNWSKAEAEKPEGQQLHEKIADMNTRYYDLRGKIVKAERRIAVLTERGEMWAQYNRYKTVHKQLARVKPEKRELFEQRHSRELILYDAAARYLKELKAMERLRKAANQLARQERDKSRDRGPER